MKGAPVRSCMGGGEVGGQGGLTGVDSTSSPRHPYPRRCRVRGLRSKLSDLESLPLRNGYNKGHGDTNWVMITRLT